MSKNICILGGSFDPITYGHELVITELTNLHWVDELWIVVAKFRGSKKLIDFHHRFEMILLTLNTTFKMLKNKIILKDLEYADKWTPTYELLKIQKEKHPNNTFFFCLGSDILNEIFTWYNSKKLILENNFIIIERGNFKIDPNTLKEIPNNYLIKFDHLREANYISASQVRELLEKKNNLDDLKKFLNPLVISYIKKYNLYENLE